MNKWTCITICRSGEVNKNNNYSVLVLYDLSVSLVFALFFLFQMSMSTWNHAKINGLARVWVNTSVWSISPFQKCSSLRWSLVNDKGNAFVWSSNLAIAFIFFLLRFDQFNEPDHLIMNITKLWAFQFGDSKNIPRGGIYWFHRNLVTWFMVARLRAFESIESF